MPWSRSESDPIKARRRQLAEQERQLAERMARLNRELRNGGEAPVEPKKAPEPPVWREDELKKPIEPRATAPRRRELGKQRQRDKVIFFLCTTILLVLIGIVFWLWKTHVATAPGG